MRTGGRLVRLVVVGCLASSLVGALASPAAATFHLIKIRQVFAGTTDTPDAQYVELQAYSAGQSQLNSHAVDIFDASGNNVGSFAFTAPVLNFMDQATILVATSEAETFFGVTADLAMDPVIPAAGGKACWADTVDCVSWGSYSGSAQGTGTPFDAGEGIVAGAAMERIVSGGDNTGGLDEKDDTNNSSKDFHFAAPAPTNNFTQTGPAPGGTISFADTDFGAAEDAGTATVTVNRAGGTGSADVSYSTSDATATAGTDYTEASGTLSFAEGDTEKTFEVTLKNDTRSEGNETVLLHLRNPTGMAVLGSPDATLTINDDEPPDETAPVSTVKVPATGASYGPAKIRTLKGTAKDGGSGVASVQIALMQRLESGRCRWFSAGKFVAGKCGAKRWVAAAGTAMWTFHLAKPLPGSEGTNVRYYVAFSRATDVAGNRERTFTKGRNANRFEVT